MTKTDLVRALADECGLLVPHARQIVDRMFDLIMDATLAGGFEVRGFGVLETKWTEPRIGRNPLKPEIEIPIPSRPKVVFRPSKEFRDRAIKTLAVAGRKK
jgi:DNA-binding protein HU-beta/integration host factor subunit alpha